MSSEKRWPEKEAELASAVVAWLRAYHWEVYQEVQVYSGGSVADIVAVQGPLVWVIECKKTVCFDLLAQADNWRPLAHYTSVCVPRISDRAQGLTNKILKLTGIGLVRADEHGRVWESVPARINRRADAAKMRGVLREEHKTYSPAGTDTGKRWTAFRETCEKVRRMAEASPGIEMKALLASITTHYATPASARANIKIWVEAGKVEGVKLVRSGRRLLFYPTSFDVEAAAPPDAADDLFAGAASN